MTVFDQIQKESERLAAADDRISAFIKDTESRLQQLQPGLRSEFCWRDQQGFERLLAFEKDGGLFRFTYADEDRPRPTLLGGTPRDIRASVVTALANGKTPLEHLLEQICADLVAENATRAAVIANLEKGGRR